MLQGVAAGQAGEIDAGCGRALTWQGGRGIGRCFAHPASLTVRLVDSNPPNCTPRDKPGYRAWVAIKRLLWLNFHGL
jgi:hypothetical protein